MFLQIKFLKNSSFTLILQLPNFYDFQLFVYLTNRAEFLKKLKNRNGCSKEFSEDEGLCECKMLLIFLKLEKYFGFLFGWILTWCHAQCMQSITIKPTFVTEFKMQQHFILSKNERMKMTQLELILTHSPRRNGSFHIQLILHSWKI